MLLSHTHNLIKKKLKCFIDTIDCIRFEIKTKKKHKGNNLDLIEGSNNKISKSILNILHKRSF